MFVVRESLAERNTKLLQFLTSSDIRIHRLMFTVRYWAKLRRVAGCGGRLTSYALTLLVVYYLQTVSDPLIPSVDAMSQLAGALSWHATVYHVFNFYAQKQLLLSAQ